MMLRPLLALSLLAACGSSLRGSRADAPPDARAGRPTVADDSRGGTRQIELEPLRIEVVEKEGGGTEAVTSDARSLFDQGNDLLLQRQFDQAIAAFDELVADFPASALVASAQYNAGIAYEAKEEWSLAADRFAAALAGFPAGSGDARDAAFRLGSVQAEGKQYAASVDSFEKLLGGELSAEDRLEGLARLGYALVELKDYEGAEEVLRQALAWFKAKQPTGEITTNYFASMAQYYLAVIPHRQFRAIPLRYPEEQMGRDLEHKSDVFLIAYERYMLLLDQYPNPYWTTASIYQLGQMHKEFWDDFLIVPMPPGMSEAGQKEYVKLLNANKELEKLLEKSLFFHEKNVVLSRDAGIDTVWVDASGVRAGEVKGLLARRQKGETFAPGVVPGDKDVVGDEGLQPDLPGSGEEATDYVPARRNL
jgi:TolA-binding protein